MVAGSSLVFRRSTENASSTFLDDTYFRKWLKQMKNRLF